MYTLNMIVLHMELTTPYQYPLPITTLSCSSSFLRIIDSIEPLSTPFMPRSEHPSQFSHTITPKHAIHIIHTISAASTPIPHVRPFLLLLLAPCFERIPLLYPCSGSRTLAASLGLLDFAFVCLCLSLVSDPGVAKFNRLATSSS